MKKSELNFVKIELKDIKKELNDLWKKKDSDVSAEDIVKLRELRQRTKFLEKRVAKLDPVKS